MKHEKKKKGKQNKTKEKERKGKKKKKKKEKEKKKKREKEENIRTYLPGRGRKSCAQRAAHACSCMHVGRAAMQVRIGREPFGPWLSSGRSDRKNRDKCLGT